MSEWLGRTLSKVTLESLVGRGGMAEVYVGRHTTLNRPVAVKILHAHMSDDPELLRRFQAEAQSVAGLRHPNIVQVLDFDVANGRPYIVMELLAGLPLSEYLKSLHDLGHSLSLPSILRLTSGIASALDYAHARGIVHRDVKPANVILRHGSTPLQPGSPLAPDVEPVLTDFGVARIADATTQTASGLILGTPAYMSPEQVRGETVDARSDIYSLGVILYEMLAGQKPFGGQGDTTPASVLYKQVHEQPPPIPATSPEIREVVAHALAKDREKRHQSAGGLAKALEAAISGRPSESVAVGPSDLTTVRETRPDRRGSAFRAWPLIWGGAAILTVLGILAVRGIFANVPSAPAAEPTRATETAAPTELVASPEISTPISPAPTLAAQAPAPVGMGIVRSTGVSILVDAVPSPPDGFEYHAWLAAPDTSQLLHVGPAAVVSGVLTIGFQAPQDADLLATFDTLLVTLEPTASEPVSPGQVTHKGTLEAEAIEVYRRFVAQSEAGADVDALLQAAGAQAVRLSDHLGYTVDALTASDLPGAKTHSEHIINLGVGGSDPDFHDWDGNGRAESPGGDEVGVVPYLRLIAVMLQGAGESKSEGDDIRALALELNDEIAEVLIPRAERAIALAIDVAGADSLELVQTLGLQSKLTELQEYKGLVASAIQRIKDSGLPGEMGLVTHVLIVGQP